MILSHRNGIACFQYPQLKALPEIRHAVFTRHGGYSRKPFAGLNVSLGIGDDPNMVRKNRDIIRESLDAEELVFARQVHGTEVRVIASSEDSLHNASDRSRPPEADALVTHLKNKFLVIQVADCQAIFLYDRSRRVIANIHAGWRGSIGNIIGQTIDVMRRRYSSDPRQLVAAIGPSLGPCCAEFIHYRLEIPEAFWAYRNDADHFDFWSISRNQLLEAGLSQRNIFSSDICTRCHPEHFYSYRGEKETGRFAAVIGMV
jgi:YfiH family protein